MTRPSLSLVRRFFITLIAFAIIAPAMLTQEPLVAQEEATEEKPADAKAGAAGEDLFKVPEGDAKAIHEYMKKVAKTPPEGDSPEEQTEFAIKALTSLTTAADRLLASKPTERQEIEAHAYRLEALQALVAMEQEGAREKFEKAVKAARESDREQVVGLGWQTYIKDRVQRWSEVGDEDKQTLFNDIMATVNAEGPQEVDVSIVQLAALSLDREDDAFVAKLLEAANPVLAKSEDKAVQKSFAESNLEGVLRRLKLPGNELEISGELLSGGNVDWNSYRGKVVLVDFWATWCGPCRAEVPNILAMYEAYHDKGFDVLGVSLDDAPEDAKKYAEQNKLPWDSLFPKDEAERSWNHPLARHYGIGGIPTAILVDKEGKVVNMNARGEILQEELRRLLGEPAAKPDAENTEAEAESAAKAS
jgi:thiol-disulfide isomerase/thioredoxin